MTTAELADTAVTPAALLDALRVERSAADAAEARVLQIGVEWAHSHPAPDGGRTWRVGPSTALPLGEVDGTVADLDPGDPRSEELVEWCGIPPVAWDAPAAFAAANRMSTGAGKALLRDALVLHHRLPRTWARVLSGDVQAWRARRVAQAVLGAPADVTAHVDAEVAPVAGTIGVVALDRVVDRAMKRLHAEAYELDHAEASGGHHVTLHGGGDHTGTADMSIRGDWKDLHELDQAVGRVAAALGAAGDPDPLGARRARALGVLADPEAAAALLRGDAAPGPTKQAVLYLHLSDLAVLGADPVGLNETTRQPALAEVIRAWLGRTDTHVVVKPVLDLAEHVECAGYEVSDRLREQSGLIHPTCVFPWCTRPARRCDCDHIDSFADDGPTCSHNIAPLCRHHHRLKTLAGWRYRRLDTRQFLWTDPHGLYYLRDRGGTTVVSRTLDPTASAAPPSATPGGTPAARWSAPATAPGCRRAGRAW